MAWDDDLFRNVVHFHFSSTLSFSLMGLEWVSWDGIYDFFVIFCGWGLAGAGLGLRGLGLDWDGV